VPAALPVEADVLDALADDLEQAGQISKL
jgi:hypothetical protein